MRSEDDVRAMARLLNHQAEHTNTELRALLDKPDKTPEDARQIDKLLRRWQATIRAMDALIWAAGDFTDDELISLVQERTTHQ